METIRLLWVLCMLVLTTSTPVFPDAFTTVVLDETGDYHRVFWDGEGARARVFHGVDNFNDVFVCNQTRRELTHYSINASGRCDVQVSSVSECLAAIRTELLNHGLQVATLVDGVSPFAQRIANDSGCAPMPAPAYPISASNCDRSCHHWRSTSDAPCGSKVPAPPFSTDWFLCETMGVGSLPSAVHLQRWDWDGAGQPVCDLVDISYYFYGMVVGSPASVDVEGFATSICKAPGALPSVDEADSASSTSRAGTALRLGSDAPKPREWSARWRGTADFTCNDLLVAGAEPLACLEARGIDLHHPVTVSFSQYYDWGLKVRRGGPECCAVLRRARRL